MTKSFIVFRRLRRLIPGLLVKNIISAIGRRYRGWTKVCMRSYAITVLQILLLIVTLSKLEK